MTTFISLSQTRNKCRDLYSTFVQFEAKRDAFGTFVLFTHILYVYFFHHTHLISLLYLYLLQWKNKWIFIYLLNVIGIYTHLYCCRFTGLHSFDRINDYVYCLMLWLCEVYPNTIGIYVRLSTQFHMEEAPFVPVDESSSRYSWTAVHISRANYWAVHLIILVHSTVFTLLEKKPTTCKTYSATSDN